MTDDKDYLSYLRQHSAIGLAYRKLWLYPRLSRYLNGRVLDVGCGIGDMLRFLPNATGTDIDPMIVEWCRSAGLNVHLMTVGHLPFSDAAAFDSVILDNVLEHIMDPRLLLQEIRRVLRAGGRFVVGVPGRKGYASDPDHKIFYDDAALERCVVASGFRLERMFHMPIRLHVLSSRLSIYCTYGVFRKEG